MADKKNPKNRESDDYHTQQHTYEHKTGTLLHEMCYSVKGFTDHGAIRDTVELILKSKGIWEAIRSLSIAD